MSKLLKKATAMPDVEVGDELYFQHPKLGPASGKVVAHGRHGVMLDCETGRHKVRWDGLLGHKARARPAYRVVDQGEDGLVVEGDRGQRKFISDPIHEPVTKAIQYMLDVYGGRSELFKSIKDGPGKSLRDVMDKAGRNTRRWMNNSEELPKQRRQAAPDEAGAAHGFGTHNMEVGDKVSFKMGSLEGGGKIVAMGATGATVEDSEGREHLVHWREVTGHVGMPGRSKPHVKGEVRGKQSPVSPENFSAADFAKEHDKADVTPEDVLSHFPADTAEKIEAAQKRLNAIEQTIQIYKKDGNYTAVRSNIHDEIVMKFLSPEKIAAASPAAGEKPTFTLLGGRGGSGKSALKGVVYDPDKAIVLDADEIKKMLPEYEGWNAAQVHEESSDLFDFMTDYCMANGLNLVHDATMKTEKKAVELVKRFKSRGYRIEAHYMHLPRQEAAKRAVARFLGETKRYVPVEVVLSNTSNEKSFDAIRQHADAWSFRDNNVPRGSPPVLISESGGNGTRKPKGEKKDGAGLKNGMEGDTSES